MKDTRLQRRIPLSIRCLKYALHAWPVPAVDAQTQAEQDLLGPQGMLHTHIMLPYVVALMFLVAGFEHFAVLSIGVASTLDSPMS